MRVVWSPLALDRAAEAAKYIARDGPEVAAAWVDGLFDVVGKLLQFPRRGRVLTVRHQRSRFTEAALEGE